MNNVVRNYVRNPWLIGDRRIAQLKRLNPVLGCWAACFIWWRFEDPALVPFIDRHNHDAVARLSMQRLRETLLGLGFDADYLDGQGLTEEARERQTRIDLKLPAVVTVISTPPVHAEMTPP